jgi:hypothetical protein
MKPIKRKHKNNSFKPKKHDRDNSFKPKKHKKTRYKLPKKKEKELVTEKIVEEDVKVGEYGFIHIYFNVKDQHFYLRYVNKDGTKGERRNMYAPSYINALCNALNKVKEMKLLTTGIAKEPPPEENA